MKSVQAKPKKKLRVIKENKTYHETEFYVHTRKFERRDSSEDVSEESKSS